MRDERAFTILELLVTLAIVGILSGIAVATYDAYRKRGYEASAMTYMRSWVPAQEAYLQTFGHYADADEQLQEQLGILKVPTNIPYNFSIDSGSSETERWWGRGRALVDGLRHLYIDQTGVILSSLTGPPSPP